LSALNLYITTKQTNIAERLIIKIKDTEIFLCFTCDPFPIGVSNNVTYELIKLIKESGNRVAILTKGRPTKELFAMLDSDDRFGVTIACGSEMMKELEPNASTYEERISFLKLAKLNNIPTFVSFEPVFEPEAVYELIKSSDFIDDFRIGKLNYVESNINWKEFGFNCVQLCEEYKRNYKIKEGLVEEMLK